jgi:hypothetical protein
VARYEKDAQGHIVGHIVQDTPDIFSARSSTSSTSRTKDASQDASQPSLKSFLQDRLQTLPKREAVKLISELAAEFDL